LVRSMSDHRRAGRVLQLVLPCFRASDPAMTT
jgi:hypothetical protein